MLCVVNETGAPVLYYTYDAWGSFTVTPAAGASNQEVLPVATLNPAAYRGYYYDNELSLYYLQARYYDPETGRFINIDYTCDTKIGLTGTNMFVYCCNNPVLLIDNSGRESNLTPTQKVAYLIGVMGSLTFLADYLTYEQAINCMLYLSNMDFDIGELFSFLVNFINYISAENDKSIGQRTKEVVQAGLEGATEATAALTVTSIAQYMAIIPQTEALTIPIMIITAAGGFVAGALIELMNP